MKVQRPVSFALTIERSKFFAVLVPLAAPGDIEAVVRARRSDVRRANHHCWAYRLIDAAGAVVEKSKDDGEVGHPGRVLLESLRRHELEGALVVSRIFGGVKLGVGGVSRAFREAADGVIAAYLAGSAPPAPARGARR